MEIPVYLFTGFLDSGKTSFIRETVEDDQFSTGEKTLLIACEEGEVEYDETVLNKYNISSVYLSKIELSSLLTVIVTSSLCSALVTGLEPKSPF